MIAGWANVRRLPYSLESVSTPYAVYMTGLTPAYMLFTDSVKRGIKTTHEEYCEFFV